MSKRIWDDFLTERDKAFYAASGLGARGGFGKRPALLVVDVSYTFCGEGPEPILESIKKWRGSCGEEAWAAIEFIKPLLAHGYTVFAVVHGSQPKFTIPEILEDMHRAVRYIRYHARDYHIDPNRIGIQGCLISVRP